MIEARELTKQFIRTQKKGKKEEFYEEKGFLIIIWYCVLW